MALNQLRPNGKRNGGLFTLASPSMPCPSLFFPQSLNTKASHYKACGNSGLLPFSVSETKIYLDIQSSVKNTILI